MQYIAPATFPSRTDRICGQLISDQEFKRDNFDICQAINTTKLGIVLERMVKTGRLHPQMKEIFEAQGGALRAAICSENYRAHGL